MTYRRQSSRVSKTLGPNDPRSHRNPQGQAMPLQFLGDGMKLSATREVSLDFATDPALEFSGTTPDGQVRVKVKTNGGITRDSNGLSLSGTGSGVTLSSGILIRAFSVTDILIDPTNANYGEYLRCDPSGGGFTVTLPVFAVPTGRDILIKNVTSSTNTITIDANTAQTFEDGTTTKTITRAYGWIWLVNIASSWHIVGDSSSTGILLADGDKGDITVSSSGTVWNIDADAVGTNEIANDAVTYAKIQNVSATDKVLGRSSSGSGDVEEITCTSAARSVLDDTTTAAMLVTLGATGRLVARTVLTSGTGATHNYNSAATTALVRMVGGGGGGSGVSGGVGNSASGGSGGAGGYTVKYITLGGVTSATYTVGAKGTGGASGANNGNNGTASTWTHNAVVYSAGLGSGGTAMTAGTAVAAAAGGAGGSTTNGDGDSIGGASGTSGIRLSGTQVVPSLGGASFWGGGGVGGANADGGAATPYGAGGGAASTIGNTNRAGGDAGPGVIVVEEYA